MKNINYILSIIVFLSLLACEDKITLDVPDGQTKIVIDGILKSTDSIQKIKISSSNEYFSNQPTPKLSGAIVTVSTSEGKELNFIENTEIKGQYEAAMTISDGVDYILNVVTPQGESYRSLSETPLRVPPIDSLYQSDSMVGSDNDNAFRSKGYFVFLTTHEPAGVGDYYRWIIYINDVQLIDPFSIYIVEDIIYDGRPIVDWDIVYELQPDDTVTIEQTSISKRAYNYWFLIQQQLTNYGGPFDTPPAPIEGNMYNVNDENETVLGFFGVSNVSKETIIIEDKGK